MASRTLEHLDDRNETDPTAYNGRDVAHDLSFRAMPTGPRGTIGVADVRDSVRLPAL